MDAWSFADAASYFPDITWDATMLLFWLPWLLAATFWLTLLEAPGTTSILPP